MTIEAVRIAEFDLWREGYGNSTVEVLVAGTSTLAHVFSDATLETEVDNPITLESRTENSRVYGKFSSPLYVSVPYQLLIDGVDVTGIVRPRVTSLKDEDASYAVASTARSRTLRRLIDRFDDVVRVEDYGDFSDSPSTNTATLNAAIGASGSQGGGFVLLPAGTREITSVTLPEGVVLVGDSVLGTTIQSREGGEVVILGGDRAGLMNITLDGLNLTPDSIGVLSENHDRTVFENVIVRRFETGLKFLGGSFNDWGNLVVENCATGAMLHGEGDSGTDWQHNSWSGGAVTQCTTAGISLKFVDAKCGHQVFRKVLFELHTTDALFIEGARFMRWESCIWRDNVDNFDVQDGADTSLAPANECANFLILGGRIEDGNQNLDGTCEDFLFERVELSDTDWVLSLPQSVITLLDCVEDSLVSVSGDTSKLMRLSTDEEGGIAGVTTDATYTTAVSFALEPGQVLYAEARVVANQRDGLDHGVFHIACGAIRPASTLAYDNQTANFTVGQIVTGGSSGATARICGDTDGGTTGTLKLRSITGTFEDNETITDALGGSAQVNGTITNNDAFLDYKGQTDIRADMSTQGTLAYDGQSANFTVGLTVTGGTSGATGVITADTDGGATGTLTLTDVRGVFVNDEALTDSGTGAAVVNGTFTITSGLDARFAVSGGNLQIQVRGIASKIFEWKVDAEKVEA